MYIYTFSYDFELLKSCANTNYLDSWYSLTYIKSKYLALYYDKSYLIYHNIKKDKIFLKIMMILYDY